MSNINPEIYKHLDEYILEAAALGFTRALWPSRTAASEAIRIANAARPVRDDAEVIRGRVQALRRAGKISYTRTCGWRLVSTEAPRG